MPRTYRDLDDRILRLLEDLDETVPLKRLVLLLREAYGGVGPSKATVWRAVNRLAARGLIDLKRRKVIREFFQYYLSPIKLPNIDELLSPRIRGNGLRVAMQVRQALKDLTRALALETPLNPEEILEFRTEGELRALANLSRSCFDQFFEQKDRNMFKLRGES